MVPVGYGEDRPRMEGLECGAIDKLTTKEEQAAHQKIVEHNLLFKYRLFSDSEE